MLSQAFDTRAIRPLSRPTHLVILAIVLVAVDVGARLMPHEPNFTPLAASALFAGFLMRNRWLAMLIPLAAMALSDLIIGIYDWRVMAAVYISIALPALAGQLGRARYGALVLGGLAVSGAVLFFIATNFAVWAFGRMYAPDLSGLISCYVAAMAVLQEHTIW